MDKMRPLMKRIKTFPKYVQTVLLEHFSKHNIALQQKQQEEQARQQKAMQQQMLAGGMPGQDKPPAAGGMPAPSKAQQPGVAPGPTDARTTSKPGRSGTTSQQQAISA